MVQAVRVPHLENRTMYECSACKARYDTRECAQYCERKHLDCTHNHRISIDAVAAGKVYLIRKCRKCRLREERTVARLSQAKLQQIWEM